MVDVSKPYAHDTYFAIEQALIRGEPVVGSGGRVPNDDVMDVIYTLLIKGGNTPQVRDGVDRPTRLATDVFPYLAPPSDGIVPAVTNFVGRAAGNLTVPGRTRWMGVAQLVSAVAGLIGVVVIVVYGVQLLIARVRKRAVLVRTRARFLLAITLCFAVATISGLISGAFLYPAMGLLGLICIVAFIRRRQWTARTGALSS